MKCKTQLKKIIPVTTWVLFSVVSPEILPISVLTGSLQLLDEFDSLVNRLFFITVSACEVEGCEAGTFIYDVCIACVALKSLLF